jgi:hypothetical protein
MRGVGAGRILVGLFTLVAAGRDDVPIFDALPPRATAAARVLAARDLVQGATLVLTPEDRVLHVARNGSAVDCLHAASMLPLVVLSPRYRRAALLSAASALAWVAVTSFARASSSRF